MARTTLRPVRRLLLAALAGGSLAAGITVIATGRSVTTDPKAESATEESSRGEAGSGVTDGLSATAEGITITGAARMAARPSIVATSGRRVATEATVQAPGDLVTAHAVELSAAVIGGSTRSQAMVQRATYGRHDLGRLAVSCHNGVATAERTGTVRLAPNVLVEYGQFRGDRVSGATVLVLGPADRVMRMVRIATVSCASPYQPRTASPAPPAPSSSDPTTSSPDMSLTTSGAGIMSASPAQPTSAPESADRSERRLVPPVPAPSTRVGHLIVTG